MEELKKGVLDILTALHPDVDFLTAEGLIDNGTLDSFDMVSLITQIKENLGVVVTADQITPERFQSLDAICTLIASAKNA